jgi:mannosyltransferase
VWLLPSVATAMAGLILIGRPEPWQDELVTVEVATRPLPRLFGLLGQIDAVHGAYYVFMHFWIKLFGDSMTVARAPSALAMAVAAGCVAAVGARLFGRPAGILGGLVFGIVPSTVRFAQETRSYAFVVGCAALSTLLLLRALDRPAEGSRRSLVLRWIAYAVSLVAVGYFSLVAVTIVAGHLVAAVIICRRRWRGLVPLLVAVVGAGVAVTPVAVLGQRQATSQVHWVPHAAFWIVWPQTTSSTLIAWALVALAALAWLGNRWSAAVGTAIALVPPVVVWLASQGTLSYFFSKYLLFAVPGWAILAGAGLAVLRPRFVPLVGLVVVGALAVPGQTVVHQRLGHSWYTYPQARPEDPMDYLAAARIIAAGYHPGDGVAYTRATWWYMHDVGVQFFLPPRVQLRDVFLARTAAEADALHAEDTTDPDGALATAREQRIWVVVPHEEPDPLQMFSEPQADALQHYYTSVWLWHVPDMSIELFVRRS